MVSSLGKMERQLIQILTQDACSLTAADSPRYRSSMAAVNFRLVQSLTDTERSVLASLVGRPLKDDEVFDIGVYAPEEASREGQRASGEKHLADALDDIQATAPDVSREEFEREVDQAMRAVRPRYQSIRE